MGVCVSFSSLFYRTTWVSRYKKDKTSLDLNEARDDRILGCSGISWAIYRRQITIPTPHHSIFTGRMLFLTPSQQCQSTEGTVFKNFNINNSYIPARWNLWLLCGVNCSACECVVQDRDINKVSETVVGTTENIKDGNDEIREVLVITVNCLSLLWLMSGLLVPSFRHLLV